MEKKRIEWIDYTKGFGICMIMLAHVSQYFPVFGPIKDYICSFHVVIFFMVSGYLASIKSGSPMDIKQRSKVLLIPYIVFSLINSGVKLGVLALQGGITGEIVRQELKELLFTGNGTVWFLLCLFFIETIFNMLCKVGINRSFILVCSILLMIAVYWRMTPKNVITIVLSRVVVGMGYYSIGYFLHKKSVKDVVPVMGAIILLLIGGIPEILFGCQTDFFEGIFQYPIQSIVSAAATCSGYMFIFDKIEKSGKLINIRKFLNYFGRNSLIVMLIHPLLLQVVMYPFGNEVVELQGIISVMVCTVIYVLLVIVEIPFIEIINRYFPVILGRGRVSSDDKNHVQQNG